MNKWSLTVVSEDAKLCISRHKGREVSVFQKDGKLTEPPDEFLVYVSLWRHIFPK
ncbi:hypothetical protein B1750_gp168 [Noumeavirus]|uniref:Uncharacterized protein n=1 Tax=Marseillevirus sp. TaxID=2809551 RepID=A0AA96IZ94_9VIRU|nr:hypothetical protein B1750_gp168 [Noumeavirus]AQM73149.1 hypothetical protein NMV_168 [Noumeavirus]WNL50399.1 hypothetical protein MarDSR_360 [Marseillevirus sp.]